MILQVQGMLAIGFPNPMGVHDLLMHIYSINSSHMKPLGSLFYDK